MTVTRAVVVEDSPAQRARLIAILESGRDISVVGQTGRASEATDLIRSLRPDVVTLDLQLGDGGGQHVIEQVMAASPVPILVLAGGGTEHESTAAVAALRAGAVDVLAKPAHGDIAAEDALRARVRLVAGVAVVRRGRRTARAAPARPRRPADRRDLSVPVVAIGASTGGPAALAEVLAGIGGIDASVIVVQHLNPDFVDGFMQWMDRVCPLGVRLATDGARLEPGVVLIAPGGVHVRVSGDDQIVLDPEPHTLHRPSVDVLFTSLAQRTRGRAVGVLLTGMGEDGAAGLLAMRTRGDVTIAQDEATSAVFGMPRAAARLGAAAHVVPLDRVASAIVRSL